MAVALCSVVVVVVVVVVVEVIVAALFLVLVAVAVVVAVFVAAVSAPDRHPALWWRLDRGDRCGPLCVVGAVVDVVAAVVVES